MTIGELIDKKNYDCVSYRVTPPKNYNEESIFAGCFAVHDGKIISLDGDTYYREEEVVSYEEWSSDKIKNGLTIVVKTEWYSDETE